MQKCRDHEEQKNGRSREKGGGREGKRKDWGKGRGTGVIDCQQRKEGEDDGTKNAGEAMKPCVFVEKAVATGQK